eukprot:CAMPEP_0180221822 /NCGR_PEP_ID=MMETSP0987-20121128/20188_1 /TAXON_ID=697907 /ORGANISM="non described non described, Strain CCMP2293" /LENGTH=186 /DNA_ID=CAMNT_0022183481 /DNA_START=162 /DNA_END=719 /DNA_ORIENTATION=+
MNKPKTKKVERYVDVPVEFSDFARLITCDFAQERILVSLVHGTAVRKHLGMGEDDKRFVFHAHGHGFLCASSDQTHALTRKPDTRFLAFRTTLATYLKGLEVDKIEVSGGQLSLDKFPVECWHPAVEQVADVADNKEMNVAAAEETETPTDQVADVADNKEMNVAAAEETETPTDQVADVADNKEM